jgi:hypothetical protein
VRIDSEVLTASTVQRIEEGDAEGRSKLAGYMLRTPKALEKMAYDAGTGTAIYRSKTRWG